VKRVEVFLSKSAVCETVLAKLTLDRMPVPKKASSGMMAMTPISPTVDSNFFSRHQSTMVTALTTST